MISIENKLTHLEIDKTTMKNIKKKNSFSKDVEIKFNYSKEDSDTQLEAVSNNYQNKSNNKLEKLNFKAMKKFSKQKSFYNKKNNSISCTPVSKINNSTVGSFQNYVEIINMNSNHDNNNRIYKNTLVKPDFKPFAKGRINKVSTENHIRYADDSFEEKIIFKKPNNINIKRLTSEDFSPSIRHIIKNQQRKSKSEFNSENLFEKNFRDCSFCFIF